MAHNDIWYKGTPGEVGHRLIELMVEEWKGVLYQRQNFNILLVFTHILLTKNIALKRARVVCKMIGWHKNLWDKVQYTGLIGESDK